MLVSIRTIDPGVRDRVMAAIDRIVRAEAAASGAVRAPEIVRFDHAPALINDEEATARTRAALAEIVPHDRFLDPGLIPVSEDCGVFATEAGVPCVYWMLGGGDGARVAPGRATSLISTGPHRSHPTELAVG